MRNVNRIPPLLAEMAEYWRKNPDLRMTQLMCNFLGFVNMETKLDPFFVEDDKTAELWRKYIDENLM